MLTVSWVKVSAFLAGWWADFPIKHGVSDNFQVQSEECFSTGFLTNQDTSTRSLSMWVQIQNSKIISPDIINILNMSQHLQFHSSLQGYSKKNAYICTQLPLEHTRSEFWRMVHDYKCPAVVVLDSQVWTCVLLPESVILTLTRDFTAIMIEVILNCTSTCLIHPRVVIKSYHTLTTLMFQILQYIMVELYSDPFQ